MHAQRARVMLEESPQKEDPNISVSSLYDMIVHRISPSQFPASNVAPGRQTVSNRLHWPAPTGGNTYCGLLTEQHNEQY